VGGSFVAHVATRSLDKFKWNRCGIHTTIIRTKSKKATPHLCTIAVRFLGAEAQRCLLGWAHLVFLRPGAANPIIVCLVCSHIVSNATN